MGDFLSFKSTLLTSFSNSLLITLDASRAFSMPNQEHNLHRFKMRWGKRLEFVYFILAEGQRGVLQGQERRAGVEREQIATDGRRHLQQLEAVLSSI
jgi:hypothetical protein